MRKTPQTVRIAASVLVGLVAIVVFATIANRSDETVIVVATNHVESTSYLSRNEVLSGFSLNPSNTIKGCWLSPPARGTYSITSGSEARFAGERCGIQAPTMTLVGKSCWERNSGGSLKVELLNQLERRFEQIDWETAATDGISTTLTAVGWRDDADRVCAGDSVRPTHLHPFEWVALRVTVLLVDGQYEANIWYSSLLWAKRESAFGHPVGASCLPLPHESRAEAASDEAGPQTALTSAARLKKAISDALSDTLLSGSCAPDPIQEEPTISRTAVRPDSHQLVDAGRDAGLDTATDSGNAVDCQPHDRLAGDRVRRSASNLARNCATLAGRNGFPGEAVIECHGTESSDVLCTTVSAVPQGFADGVTQCVGDAFRRALSDHPTDPQCEGLRHHQTFRVVVDP